MAALIRQANCWHQMKETAETTSKPRTVAYLQARGGGKTHTNTTKSQQSATKEWTTTVRSAQSKNNCAKDKQMESQTNHNLL